MTQIDLLARYATHKDADAFAQIVAQYQQLVFATCRRILSNRDDIDDAVQETFLRLAQKSSSLRSNLGAWLHTCAANVSIDMNRRRHTRSHHESAVSPKPAYENDSQRTLAELREHLDAALQKLNAADRELIIQRLFVGRQQIDLAKEAGVAPSTINHRIERAVEALREHLNILGCGIAVATTLTGLLETEHASASVPPALHASIVKIGLTGVTGKALSASLIIGMLGFGLTALISIGIWLSMNFTPARAQPASQPVSTAPPLHGRVLSPDGKPVPGATVFVALPQPSNLRIRNGKVEADDPRVPRAVSGADGDYRLTAQTGEFNLQVIDDTGYAEADQDAVAKNSDIRLTAWGRIQGMLMLGTKPDAGEDVQAFSTDQRDTKTPHLSMINLVLTDQNGNYTMDRVVPGEVQILRLFPQKTGKNTMVFTADLGTAQVTAGQTTTANFGGTGRPVSGKFIYPSGMNPSDYFINARAWPLEKDAPNPRGYFLDVDTHHNFIISNVPPGDFQIHIFLQKVHGDRTAQPNETQFTMPGIPGGVSDDPLVIPDIQLQSVAK